MSRAVEIDEHGAIQLPNALLARVRPRTCFMLEIQGTTLIFRPEGEQPFLNATSPPERAEAVRRWASVDRPAAPVLPDEALGREQMYD